MDNQTLKDVLLIAKGWYNKTHYHTQLEALNAYYHLHYGCEDITMDKSFAESLFLRPLVLRAIEIKPALARYLLEPTFGVLNEKQSFAEAMYDRMICFIHRIDYEMFDLSEYEEMFRKAKDCNYEDQTIGII